MFSRDEHIRSLGYEVAVDGSTRNIPAYFKHVRENIVNQAWRYFWYYFVVATLAGAFVYYLAANTLETPMMDVNNQGELEGGKVYGMYDTGVAVYMVLIFVHHFNLIIEVRSFNAVVVTAILLSIACYVPFQIYVNNALAGSPYYKNQWLLYRQPMVYLYALLATFCTVAPRYIWSSMERAVVYPEFSNIKSD
jgi:hypothetical protein